MSEKRQNKRQTIQLNIHMCTMYYNIYMSFTKYTVVYILALVTLAPFWNKTKYKINKI